MKLIDKTAVVAEIERLDNYWHLSKNTSGQAFVESLLSFLNTLEVKEFECVDRQFYMQKTSNEQSKTRCSQCDKWGCSHRNLKTDNCDLENMRHI